MNINSGEEGGGGIHLGFYTVNSGDQPLHKGPP